MEHIPCAKLMDEVDTAAKKKAELGTGALLLRGFLSGALLAYDRPRLQGFRRPTARHVRPRGRRGGQMEVACSAAAVCSGNRLVNLPLHIQSAVIEIDKPEHALPSTVRRPQFPNLAFLDFLRVVA